MLALWVTLVSIVLIYYFTEWLLKWRKMPPGPYGLPLLGYVHKFDPLRPWKTMNRLFERYGPIVSYTNTHGLYAVALNDWDDVNNIFNKDESIQRPSTVQKTITSFGHNAGLLSSHHKVWKDNRRFTLRTLRDFGFGKKSLNDIIMSDVSAVSDRLAKCEGKPLRLELFLNVAIVNTLSQLVSNESHDLDDPKLLDFFEKVASMHEALSNIGFLCFLHPWFFNLTPGGRKRLEVLKKYQERSFQMKEIIEEHKKTRDNTFNRDFIDAYLQEIQDPSKIDSTTMNEEQLFCVIHNLFFAGADSTSTSLRWTICLLAQNPQVQLKAQELLDQVIGRNRAVSLEDRESLPYIDAIVYEGQRHASVIPIPARACAEEFTYKGYVFPKGTMLNPNTVGIHMSEKYWSNPKAFEPSRFLDENGKAKQGRIPGYLAFGMGKRHCIGEPVARMELFLFLANLLQRFTFKPIPGEPLPADEDSFFSTVSKRLPSFRLLAEIR